jgi:hypothetical protein
LTNTINYSAALCSAGKTEFACHLMASTPGQYLLAVDRREVIEARIARIDQKAAEAGTYPVIRPIFSKSEGRFVDGTDNVRRRIREQPTTDHETPHVIVICTHEGLLTSDPSTYQGWTLIIDETPNLWTFREVQTQFTWPLYERFFRLRPIGEGLAEVEIRRDAPTVEACKRDAALSSEFCDTLRRWQSSRPVVNLTSWEQAGDGRQWWWSSVWKPEKLSAFEDVMILANSFEETITYKLLKVAGVELVPFAIQDDRVWQPRNLLVRYFADSHQAGSGFWTNKNDPGGAEALTKTFDWIRANSQPTNHYYSANLGVLKALTLPGEKLQPKVCGSDAYKHLTCASFIYTAKPSTAEEQAFGMYGITRDEVIRARQNEDLVQFLWRSWLRVPDDTRDGEFRVYDREQAEFLKAFIEESGRPITVTLEHVSEAEVDAHKPKPVGRPGTQRSEAEEDTRKHRRTLKDNESKRKRRAAEKQRRLDAGIVSVRGRPPKGCREHDARS